MTQWAFQVCIARDSATALFVRWMRILGVSGAVHFRPLVPRFSPQSVLWGLEFRTSGDANVEISSCNAL